MIDNALSIALATLSAGIVTKLIGTYERQRQEAREDAKEQRAEKRSTTVIQKLDQNLDKLDKNTELTELAVATASNAYDAANSVNVKFLKIHARVDRMEERVDAMAGRRG